jgi:branched-chain amino acid transport system substrate-binding protein
MKFRKIRLLLIVESVLAVAVALAACAPQPAEAPTEVPTEAPTEPAETEGGIECPIRIAVAAHLTGPTAIYDVPPLEGHRTAVQEINEAGGIAGCQIELLELDGKSDPAKVGDAAQLGVEQGADIIIPSCDFDYGAPAAVVAQENGLVGVSQCASGPKYNSKVLGDKQFTMGIWNNTMGAVSAEHACREMGWDTAVTIEDPTYNYGVTLTKYWTEAYEQAGCEVIGESSYQQGDLSFRSQAENIVSMSPQPACVLLAGNMPDAGVVVRELRATGYAGAIVGGGSLDTSEFYGAIGDEDNTWITTLTFVDPSMGPEMASFMESFEEVNGHPPDIAYQVMGYDLIYVLKEAIEKAGTVEGDALADAMENTEFDTVQGGKLSWSDAEDGHVPSKEMVVLQVVDGDATFWGTYEASWIPYPEELRVGED